MSDHDHDQHCGDTGGDQGGGGPDTRFLDFELEKIMFDEAESIVREAFREMLKKAAKKRLKEVWGDRIKALARLAVDEALADADASFAVQAVVAGRNEAKRSLEDRIRGIVHGAKEDEGEDEDEGEGEGDAKDEGGDEAKAKGDD